VCSSICSPFSPFYCATAWRDATEGEAAHDISRPGTISTLKGKDPEVSPRILRTYDRLNQKTAIQFVGYVLEKLPFEVESIQTDNGSEFQSSFHWHVRRVRRVVPGATEITLGPQDYDSSGKPLIAWDDPVAKAQLVNVLVGDALRLLGTFEGTDHSADATAALGLLALVAGQDVEHDTWKIAQRVAPDRVVLTVDPEARHMRKSRS
jgi:hypothetical protein